MRLRVPFRYPLWVGVVFFVLSVFLIAEALHRREPLLFVIGMIGGFTTSSRSIYELEDDGIRVKYRFFGVPCGSSFYPFGELRLVKEYPYGRKGFVILELWWTNFRGKKFVFPEKDGNSLYKRLSSYVDKKDRL